jgi:outer membrane receptor protein involved in Fe transport
MGKKSIAMRPTFLSASIAAALGTAAATTTPAYAQEGEEIIITGSRIVQRDFAANSPIVTVQADLFEDTSTVGVETVLNQLPQFVPAVTQFTASEFQPSATVTPGASIVSLRGIGANRNLVLFDGRRAQPVNALLVVDTNTIPSAAIERVEIVTGGASATYGADAVSGVVNFVLKKDFEGLNLNFQTSTTELSDAGETRVEGLFGANFDGGRGNVMMGVEHAKRDAAPRVGREFFDKRLDDPTMTGTNTFLTVPWWSPSGNNPTAAAVATIFNQAPGPVPVASSFHINQSNGTVYTGDHPNGAYRYADGFPLMTPDGQPQRKMLADGTIDENQPNALVSLPLDRYTLFARGRYGINDSVEAYAQGNFAQTLTETTMHWSPATGGWGARIPHGTGIYAPSRLSNGATHPDYLPGGKLGLNCPTTGGCTDSQAFPTPPELAFLLDRRANPNAVWNLNQALDYIGAPRSTKNRGRTFQMLTGVTGRVERIDGSWDIYVSHGESETESYLVGFADLANYRNIVQSPNYGRAAVVLGPATTQANVGNGGTATCTSGLPIFERFEITDDCRLAILTDAGDLMVITQDIAEGVVQGRIAEMRAGDLRFAAGVSYRENAITYDPAPQNSRANSSTSLIGSFSGYGNSGETTSTDVFGEIALPLLADRGFVEALGLELGARYSDYDQQGTANTWKALFDLQFGNPVRLRGGFQHANRAPNVGELYAPENSLAQNTAYNGDPCGTNSFAPWGANPAFNPNYQDTIALCRQLMGPVGAEAFYAEPQTGVFGNVLVIERGNPNLHSEEADTVTLGAVFSFESFQVSVDWYKIEINDMIGIPTYDIIYENCISPALNPSRTPTGNAYCAQVQRDPLTGSNLRVDSPRQHVGFRETSGIDVQFDWRKAVGSNGAMFGVNVQSNFLDTYKIQDLPNSPIIDVVGTNGNSSEGGAQFDYRLFTGFNYSRGPLGATLRWRHYPSIKHTSYRADPQTTTQGSGAYDIFDFSGRFAFNESYELRFGVNNLFDKQPLIHGRTPTTTGNGSTLSDIYDVIGRRAYLGITAQF